jgi:hypothetical protein
VQLVGLQSKSKRLLANHTGLHEIYDDRIKEIQIDEFIKKPIHIAEFVNEIRNNLIQAETA